MPQGGGGAPPGSRRRPSKGGIGGDPRRVSTQGTAGVGTALRALLRNIQTLDEDFAANASRMFRKAAGDAPGARLGFEESLTALRSLDLEAFVDGGGAEGPGGTLGDGDDARRQLRLWSGLGEEFGVTDERCFVWIAWRGRRFVDAAGMLWPLFAALDEDKDGWLTQANIGAAVASDKKHNAADLSELRADVMELFNYHAGQAQEIDFAGFVSLVCDVQDRFVLGRLGASPLQCVLRRERGVTFLRPVTADVFALQDNSF